LSADRSSKGDQFADRAEPDAFGGQGRNEQSNRAKSVQSDAARRRQASIMREDDVAWAYLLDHGDDGCFW
jgi:hypothetical protein